MFDKTRRILQMWRDEDRYEAFGELDDLERAIEELLRVTSKGTEFRWPETAVAVQQIVGLATDRGEGDTRTLIPSHSGWKRAWAIIAERHGADVGGERWQYMGTFGDHHEFRHRARGRDVVLVSAGDFDEASL